MFYCETCKEERGYPESIMLSEGQCEICGLVDSCYDVPSFHLPKDSPKNSPDVDDFIIDFSNKLKSFSHNTQIIILVHIAEDLSLDTTATAIRESLNK